MIEPMPPRNITATVGIAGPWRDSILSAARHTTDGTPIVTVSLVAEIVSMVNLRDIMDTQARQAGWVLYEEAPAWLRAMFDRCEVRS